MAASEDTKKKPAAKVAALVDTEALQDKFARAQNELRRQLSMNETPELPDLLVQMLPANPSKGDRVVVMAWRVIVVWASYDGAAWQLEVVER